MKKLLFALLFPFVAFATTYHVSTTGLTASNGLSLVAAWPITYALGDSLPAHVQPGDTIYVHGGTYNVANIQCRLAGTKANPIVVRNFSNQRVILNITPVYSNSGIVMKTGYAYVWLWGLEFASIPTDRVSASPTGSASYSDTDVPSAISSDVVANHSGLKIINCTIRETIGMGLFAYDRDVELYGNNFFNIGIAASNAGTHYPMYVRGSKWVSNNICQNTFALLVHLYGNGAGTVDTTVLRQNILHGGGRLYSSSDDVNFLLGTAGSRTTYADTVEENYVWSTKSSGNVPRVGYTDTLKNGSFTKNRFLYSGVANSYVEFVFANSVTITGNTIMGESGKHIYQDATSSYIDGSYASNTYLNTIPVAGDSTYFLPNKYETQRGHIASYNWASADSVTVNVSSAFSAGAHVYVFNSANPFGDTPFEYTVTGGGTITVPMMASRWTTADVVGYTEPTGLSTFPTFGAFIVTGSNPLATLPYAPFRTH